MQVIKNENIRPFDIDNSLVLPKTKSDPADAIYVEVKDDVTGRPITMRVHEPMVRLLREEHSRGSHVIVWSRSGFAWAKAVVEALDLCYPDRLTIMSKPLVYFDDMDVSTWLKDRVYLTPETQYKK